ATRTCSLAPEQVVQLARTIERGDIGVAAQMLLANEDLGHGATTVGPLDHCRANGRILSIDLFVGDAFLIEQSLGGVTVRAPLSGVDFDLRHSYSGFALHMEATNLTTSRRRP